MFSCGICEIFYSTLFEVCNSPGLLFLITYASGSNWYICFSFCIIIYSFDCQFFLHYYWYCYNQKQWSGGVLQKRYSYKIYKISHENTSSENICNEVVDLQSLTLLKKRFPHIYFLEFYEISHSIFFKEPFEGCFCINNTRYSVYFPTTIFRLFKNGVAHILRLSIFSG